MTQFINETTESKFPESHNFPAKLGATIGADPMKERQVKFTHRIFKCGLRSNRVGGRSFSLFSCNPLFSQNSQED